MQYLCSTIMWGMPVKKIEMNFKYFKRHPNNSKISFVPHTHTQKLSKTNIKPFIKLKDKLKKCNI